MVVIQIKKLNTIPQEVCPLRGVLIVRRRKLVASCGVCEQHYGEMLVKHGEICEDDRVGERVSYSPEIDDLIKMEEEGNE
jgi:hypothetical protein